MFTGSYAVNPVNGKAIPIWVADYVLASYGTGAIMAVPAHDTRDFEFAQEFGLPIIPVVDPGEATRRFVRERTSWPDAWPLSRDGVAINSGRFNGHTHAAVQADIADDLANKGLGRAAVNYKLRDWLFSRQHFWGEPFPILHELDAGKADRGLFARSREELPVDLPETDDFDAQHDSAGTAAGKSARRLALRRPATASVTSGRRTPCRNGPAPAGTTCGSSIPERPGPGRSGGSRRPGCRSICTWAARSMPCLHLLYARFWHKVLFDRGYVSTAEPFRKLVNQGMILGEGGVDRLSRRGGELGLGIRGGEGTAGPRR